MFDEIACCRACGNPRLAELATFGELHLPGALLAPETGRAPMVPLELVRCDDSGNDGCGLVQLRHRMDCAELTAAGYGGRSARHPATVRHLAGIAERLRRHVSLGHTDVVVDVGSNDGTLLSCFPPNAAMLIGMDPSAGHFRRQYRADVQIVPLPFSPDALRDRLGGKKVKVLTAVGVLQSLEDPLAFFKGIRQLLDDDGIACVEQPYLPPMVKDNAHDAIRPEHSAYYTVRQLLWLAEKAQLKVLDVFTNDAEGGCVAVTLARATSTRGRPPSALRWYLETEAARKLDDPATWVEYRRRSDEQKRRLHDLLDGIRANGETVVGWGVSAAGNTLLERAGLGADRLARIASSDPGDVGRVTPGTGIPVISEIEARSLKPDYLLVLARHFRGDLLRGLEEFLLAGGKMIFPLPEVEIVTA